MNTEDLIEIWNKQAHLMGLYVSQESLPQWPLDLETKSSQNLMREFVARFTEELCEALEQYEAMAKSSEAPILPGNNTRWETLFENFTKELVDAYHFLVEILIFSDIQPAVNLDGLIQEYLENLYPENTIPWKEAINIQGTAIMIGVRGQRYHPYTIGDISSKLAVSDRAYRDISICCMYTIKTAFTARNQLKIREWREVETNIQKFQQQIAGAFYEFIVMIRALNIPYPILHKFYLEKNQINIERIPK